jgi:hypothetical protein
MGVRTMDNYLIKRWIDKKRKPFVKKSTNNMHLCVRIDLRVEQPPLAFRLMAAHIVLQIRAFAACSRSMSMEAMP